MRIYCFASLHRDRLLRFARNDGIRASHDLRPPLRLRHADARLRPSDGAAVVAQRRLHRRGALPGPALSHQTLSGAGAVGRSAEVVFGELYRLRAPDELLREFDMYEACGEGFAEPTEYVRQMLPVTLDDGAVERGLDLYLQLAGRPPAADRLGAVFGEVGRMRVPDAVQRPSGAPQSRDPCCAAMGPGSAAHHAASAARCAASGARCGL